MWCDFRKYSKTAVTEENVNGLLLFAPSPETPRDTRFQLIPSGHSSLMDRHGYANMCTVINNADIAVFDVTLVFQLRFHNYIVKGNWTGVTPLQYQADWSSEIPHLEPKAKFVFYMRNLSDYDLLIAIPSVSAMLQRPGAQKREQVRMHHHRAPIEIGLVSLRWSAQH